jgi:DNA (cytosine-5)-methyltransferase 1
MASYILTVTRSLGTIAGRFEVLIATAPAPRSKYQIEQGQPEQFGVWLVDGDRCVGLNHGARCRSPFDLRLGVSDRGRVRRVGLDGGRVSPRVGSLFSGVGGLDLALERLWGARPVVFAESEPYRRAVLASRWPGVPVLDDVTKVGSEWRGRCEVVAGGFPCQDVSTMGPKSGMAGERSGWGWQQFARVIEEVEPDAVIIENVAALRTRGLDRVLVDLDRLGFDAAWTTVEARTAGLCIRRARLFLLAVTNGERSQRKPAAWLHDHRPQRDDTHRRDAGVVRDRRERGAATGPEPGLLRGTLGHARGLDERRRRERLRCTGNAVAPDQAVLALRHLAQALA